MNDTKQVPCSCATCPDMGCRCGCQQPAAQTIPQTPCTCGPQCQCGPNCACAKS